MFVCLGTPGQIIHVYVNVCLLKGLYFTRCASTFGRAVRSLIFITLHTNIYIQIRVSCMLSIQCVIFCRDTNNVRHKRIASLLNSFAHLFRLHSKMGTMELLLHSSFRLVPPPCDPVRSAGPITINTHFLGLTAKNRMFVVCCN